MARRPRTPPAPRVDAPTLTLDDLEALVVGRHSRRASELAFVRDGSRLLRVMSGSARGPYATLICERSAEGLRIVEGCEALQVARELRAAADRRGDHTWSMLMGSMLRFELVTREAGAPSRTSTRRGVSRPAVSRRGIRSLTRVARGALAAAGA